MSLTRYKFIAGGFVANYKIGQNDYPLGSTERGITIAWDPQRFDITTDLSGSIVVGSLNLGIPFIRVTVESMHWETTAKLVEVLFDRIGVFGSNFFQMTKGELGSDMLRKDANNAGELTLTAVTGPIGGATPTKLIFPKSVPIEPASLLLTARTNIRVPFNFIAFPYPSNDAGAEVDNGDAIVKYSFFKITHT